jgi:SAM-dependent methyltransferase
LSALDADVVPLVAARKELSVLEVGGGTGSFALGLIKQAKALKGANPSFPDLKYHIVELSPELMRSQQSLLQSLPAEVTHFHQDAVTFNLPDHTFDLIVSNEVIADLPTAIARRTTSRSGQRWEGEGGAYIAEYDLPVIDAPDSFEVHKGVFDFIKRCWAHLVPGGTVILTEYAAKKYPQLMSHLSHDEWSIQFDQLTACAKKIGFESKLIDLKEFLGVDDEVLMLDGSAEQIFCLNYVLNKFGASLPYAAISKKEFETQFGDVMDQAQLVGVTYSPLKTGFHYGPDPNQFKVLILTKPA